MKKKQIQFRQGDVFIQRIDQIPTNAKPVARENGRLILAYGEVTGHAHAIAEAEDVVTMSRVDAEIAYLDASMEVFLRHEEHGTVAIPPGQYCVTIQRTYTPGAIRNVLD